MDEAISINELKERLDKDVNDIEVALALANFYYDQGDSGQSIVYYRHALDLNPAMPAALTDLGTMYWRNENIGLAERAFRKAIEQDPGFGHAWVNLGMLLHLVKNNVKEARLVWQNFLDINPKHEVAPKARELLQETLSEIFYHKQ